MEQFLRELADTGRPGLETAEPLPEQGVAELLRDWDVEARMRASGNAPALDLEWACWAARVLVRLCQYLVFRELDEGQIREESRQFQAPPGEVTSSVIWSVDLTFRYLPDLERLTRRAAEHDPLLEWIRELGREWPLSSVGMKGVDISTHRLEAVLGNPALRMEYLDRVLEREDSDRMQHPGVREAMESLCGALTELAEGLRDTKLERGRQI